MPRCSTRGKQARPPVAVDLGCRGLGLPAKRKPPAGSTLPARGLRLAGEPGSSVSVPSLCDDRFPVSPPSGVFRRPGPQSPGASAASSDLAAVAASAEPGAALASGPVSGTLGASDPVSFLSGASPFESPSGPAPQFPVPVLSVRPFSLRESILATHSGQRNTLGANCKEKPENQVPRACWSPHNAPVRLIAPPLRLHWHLKGVFGGLRKHDLHHSSAVRALRAGAKDC